jgi:hypothetical protein
VKLIPIAGALCAVAIVFYSAYMRTYDGVGVVILLVFFAYFLNLKSGRRRGAAALSPTSGAAIHTPIREFANGLACLVAGGLGVASGLRVPDVQGCRDRVNCSGGGHRRVHAVSVARGECVEFESRVGILSAWMRG